MRYHSNKLVNAAGKMWHIGLDERDIGRGVILPGDPARCEMVAKLMDNAELRAVSRGNPTYTGTYDGASVSVMSTGMGGMAVAVCVEELKHIGAKNLIRMGTCGGLQPGVEGSHIVICTAAVRGDGASRQYIPASYPAIADIDVVLALRESAAELGIPVKLGMVRSHDAFYLESPGAAEGLAERIRPWADAGVLCVENESAALFTVSSMLGGLRAGTILLSGGSLFNSTGSMLNEGGVDDYAEKVEQMTRITLRALAKLDKLDSFSVY